MLILDDDPLTAETIAHIARFIGMEAKFTTEHQAFFQALEEWLPDVIALDLIMPEMDGNQVLARLAEQDCSADIILTSGVEHEVLESARRSADENGLRIAGLLSKPFSAAQLRELLA
ncbi:hypothetical protein AT746_14255 [Lacimicrobium alkaliphilum]|uniref:Response regulatory domain-containing protein n=1 Tax=Lacimicrobium alkaliphilum TaxID=1526571 RepID=A0A0U3B224_9ALTE|nr:hypothetical protein AT746_14255 [Lacimicrobium alkaliphilum]